MDTVLTILAVICSIVGIAGCILPFLPGPPLNFIALLLMQWALSQGFQADWMVLVNGLLMSLTTVLTVFSGGNYLIKNIDLLKG